MKYPPFTIKDSTKGESVKGEGRFSEDLNRILGEWPDLCLEWSRAKRVREKREATQRLKLKSQELENLIREGVRSPGTAIIVYDKLNRLLNRVVKHGPSVQYLTLSSIVEKVDKFQGEAN